jgi:hypothetical protein
LVDCIFVFSCFTTPWFSLNTLQYEGTLCHRPAARSPPCVASSGPHRWGVLPSTSLSSVSVSNARATCSIAPHLLPSPGIRGQRPLFSAWGGQRPENPPWLGCARFWSDVSTSTPSPHF